MTTATATFRPIGSNRDLVEALADGFATLTGDVLETSSPKLVDVAYKTSNFEDGGVRLMRVSRAFARKIAN